MPTRPLAAEGVPPTTGTGRIFRVEGTGLRPIDPTTGQAGWFADLGDEPIWAGYLADRILTATAHRLVALDVKTGTAKWSFEAGDPRPCATAAQPVRSTRRRGRSGRRGDPAGPPR